MPAVSQLIVLSGDIVDSFTGVLSGAWFGAMHERPPIPCFVSQLSACGFSPVYRLAVPGGYKLP